MDDCVPQISPRFASTLAALVAGLLALYFPLGALAINSHFHIEAGDASLALNEFSRQSNLQVLFDYNVLRKKTTRLVDGDLKPARALKKMLAGTGLVFDFVNDHTLAVTPRKPSFFERLWHRAKEPDLSIQDRSRQDLSGQGIDEVLIESELDGSTHPLLGGSTLSASRFEIDRSGFATAEDFIRTLPQIFGGGPGPYTVLGNEASTNSARGSGVNLRGLDAGATLVLIDGKRVAPSGTQGAFDDISNIPLSIVDHVDVMPDAASVRYGADAIGGVVNFVTRPNFSGALTQVRGGGGTDGSQGQRQLSQIVGIGTGLVGFEFFQQDPLLARQRWQETSNLTPFGGSDFRIPFANPGTIFEDGRYYPVPSGPHGAALSTLNLAPGAPNLYDQFQGTDITPDQRRWSVFGRTNNEISDSLTLSAEGLFTRRTTTDLATATNPLVLSVPSSNPFYFNPSGGTGPVTVLYGSRADFGPPLVGNRIDTGNFSIGMTTAIWEGWIATGYAAYTFEKQHQRAAGQVNQVALNEALADPDPTSAFNPFGEGKETNPATLAAIGTSTVFDSNSSLTSVGATAVGHIIELPAGDLTATVGQEFRSQSFDTFATLGTPSSDYDPRSALGRHIVSTFAEFQVPLIGADNSGPFARQLEVSLSGRYEHYSDVGGGSVPKFGLLWSPAANTSFRGTWSQSFRPPNLPDLIAKSSYSTVQTLSDPSSSTGSTAVLIRYGTNPELRTQRARTWTFAADLTPAVVPGLSASLTYFNTRYAGRIDRAQITPDVLGNPQDAWLINRNYTSTDLSEACTHSVYVGTPGTCLTSSVGAIVDDREQNIQLLKTDGVDVLTKYDIEIPRGTLGIGLSGTYLFHYSQADSPGTPLLNDVSTQNNPVNLRVRGSTHWTYGRVDASAYINFTNSYRDTISVPNRGVSPWTTLDTQLRLETSADELSWLGHTQFVLSVHNIFARTAPFLNNRLGVGYDQENADLYGRRLSFEVLKHW